MGRRGSVLTLVVINVIVTLVVVFAAVSFINSQNANQPANQVVITVPVLITATSNGNATEEVRIVTATPLPGTPGVVALPTGLIESVDATAAALAPTIDPSLISQDVALQGTATALPPNCILHTVVEGDTPFGIAEQYDTDGTRLMEVNGLTDETAALLQIGDVLIVPLEGCPLAAATPRSVESAAEVPTETETPSGSPTEIPASPTPTATPSQIPTATLPPTATNAQVEIVRVLSSGDINAEGVDIRNNGAVVDLTGWKLSSSSGETYTFPQQRLFTGSVLTVYTRVGTDTPTAKFWGLDTALWTPGATLTLTDGGGRVQSTFIVQ
ncbi:MAG: lamin tail domain-containing protein [Anaerolineae bacterium]